MGLIVHSTGVFQMTSQLDLSPVWFIQDCTYTLCIACDLQIWSLQNEWYYTCFLCCSDDLQHWFISNIGHTGQLYTPPSRFDLQGLSMASMDIPLISPEYFRWASDHLSLPPVHTVHNSWVFQMTFRFGLCPVRVIHDMMYTFIYYIKKPA